MGDARERYSLRLQPRPSRRLNCEHFEERVEASGVYKGARMTGARPGPARPSTIARAARTPDHE